MTLSRQLTLVLLSLVLLLFLSMSAIHLQQLKGILNKQIDVQTQDAVDAMAETLKPYFESNDIAGARVYVDGFFSQENYQSLTISEDGASQAIIRRTLAKGIVGVPGWFVRLINISAPIETAAIKYYRDGHMKRNVITLEARTDYAFQQLWQATRQTMILPLITLIAGAVLFVFLVRWQLAPLEEIEAQALAISRRNFGANSKVPKARELKNVVLAMNSMSMKLKNFIDELTDRAEEILRKNRIDEVSGAMNRHGVLESLESLREQKGVLAIVHFRNLRDANSAFGYQVGNQILRNIADSLQATRDLYHDAFFGRLSGTEFALVAPGLGLDEFREIFDHHLVVSTGALADQDMDGFKPKLYVGVAEYMEETHAGQVLAKANQALALAMHQETTIAYLSDSEFQYAHISSDWGQLIDQVISGQQVSLTSQAVCDFGGKEILHCLLSRPVIGDDDSGKHTAGFVAMAEQLGRAIEFDKLVVGKVLDYLQNRSDTSRVSIKLTSSSWYSERFQKWLQAQLEESPEVASQILFCCTEFTLNLDVRVSGSHIESLRTLGAGFMMDHFGNDLGSFATLRELKPDFIKLNGSFVRELPENPDTRMFVAIVVDIASGLDIGVIAEHVESEAEKRELQRLKINALQGFAVSQVDPLKV